MDGLPKHCTIKSVGTILTEDSEEGEEWEVIKLIGNWTVRVRSLDRPDTVLELSRRKSGRWARIGKSSHDDFWFKKP